MQRSIVAAVVAVSLGACSSDSDTISNGVDSVLNSPDSADITLASDDSTVLGDLTDLADEPDNAGGQVAEPEPELDNDADFADNLNPVSEAPSDDDSGTGGGGNAGSSDAGDQSGSAAPDNSNTDSQNQDNDAGGNAGSDADNNAGTDQNDADQNTGGGVSNEPAGNDVSDAGETATESQDNAGSQGNPVEQETGGGISDDAGSATSDGGETASEQTASENAGNDTGTDNSQDDAAEQDSAGSGNGDDAGGASSDGGESASGNPADDGGQDSSGQDNASEQDSGDGISDDAGSASSDGGETASGDPDADGGQSDPAEQDSGDGISDDAGSASSDGGETASDSGNGISDDAGSASSDGGQSQADDASAGDAGNDAAGGDSGNSDDNNSGGSGGGSAEQADASDFESDNTGGSVIRRSVLSAASSQVNICTTASDQQNFSDTRIGDFILHNNAWRPGRAAPGYEWTQCIYTNTNGALAGWEYDWGPGISGLNGNPDPSGDFYVRSYPELIFGVKDEFRTSAPKSVTGLPVLLSELPNITIDYSYNGPQYGDPREVTASNNPRFPNGTTISGERNIAIESFLYTPDASGECSENIVTRNGGSNHQYEVMVWLDAGAERLPAGPSDFVTDVNIRGEAFKVYTKDSDERYIAFVAQNPQTSGTLVWNDFTDWARTYAHRVRDVFGARSESVQIQDSWCVANILVGTEIFWGRGNLDLFEWTITQSR